jgi:hypothetical protein
VRNRDGLRNPPVPLRKGQGEGRSILALRWVFTCGFAAFHSAIHPLPIRFAPQKLRFVAYQFKTTCGPNKVPPRSQKERIHRNQLKESIMKNTYNTQARSTNSVTGFAVGVVLTGLLFGGYEASQNELIADAIHTAAVVQSAQSDVVKLDTVVITAKRIHKA